MTIRKNDLKGGSCGHLLYWLAFIFYVLFLFSPILLKFILNPYEETIYTFLRPLLIIVSFVSLCFVAKHRILSICLLIIFACTTICEWVMLCNYAYYMDIDTFMAFATTNWEEGSHFALNNLHALWYIIPLLLVFIALSVLYVSAVLPPIRTRLTMCVVAMSISAVGLLPIEKIATIHHVQDLKTAVFKNTFSTPPLNILHLTKITTRQLQRNKQVSDFSFGSTRGKNIQGKEIYVLAIGESVRYANCSLNGVYPRNTMPRLSLMDNLLFFNNYYSTGCTTSTSIPMIVTRATAEENALSYQEKGVWKVFQENGFTTAVIQRGLFAQPSSAYLYQGVDVATYASSDMEVVQKVDSLAKQYDKLFVMFHMRGSHFYYDNFLEYFNQFRPNNIYDKDVESDSLLINSYDNTILYTDYLLSSMIDSLRMHQAISAVWYMSDHGQTITATQGWHGTVCDSNEYHVPLFMWYSDEYKAENEDLVHTLQMRTDAPINADNIFYTLCGMTHIEMPEYFSNDAWDLSSPLFSPHPRTLYAGGRVVCLEE